MELRTKQVCWHVSADHNIYHPAMSSDGGMLAFEVAGKDSGTVEVWDTRRGRHVARLDGLAHPFVYEFLPNSDILTLFDYQSSRAPRVVLYGIPSCKRLGTIEHPEVGGISLCADGRSVAISEKKNAIGIWDLQRARLGRKETHSKEHSRAHTGAEPGRVIWLVRRDWWL